MAELLPSSSDPHATANTHKIAPIDVPQQTITEIVKYLVETFGDELALPGWHDDDFVSGFAKKAKISLGTARNIKSGNSKTLTVKIRSRLSELFREVIPHIEQEWFRYTDVGTFIEKVQEQPRNKKIISFAIPADGYKNFERLRKWLCGVYICYRYAFLQTERRLVAREVLSVWEQNSTLWFQMSFLPGRAEPEQRVRKFDGIVLPLGDSVFFVGWSEERGRSLFVHCDYADEAKDCRIGILSSTRLGSNGSPLAACILMLRRQAPPKNIDHLMEDATASLPFEEMIDADFGRDAHELVGKFLNNKPLAFDEDHHPILDMVLRLNLFRFSAGMPPLYRAAMDNEALNPPFKAGWLPISQETKK